MAGTWNGQKREDNGQFGAAIYPKDDVVFDDDEYEEWMDAGFNQDAADKWRSIRCSPTEAEDWMRYSFTADDASQWRNYFSPNSSDNWRSNGFSYEDAVTWHDTFLPDEAHMWRRAGFDYESARSWNESFSIREADELRTAGLTCQAATDWREHGFSPDETIAWRQGGFSPVEAEEWFLEFHVDSPQEANKWIGKTELASHMTAPSDQWQKGKSVPPLAKEWLASGFSIDAALGWIRTGSSPQYAREWVDAFGPNPDDSRSWRTSFSSAQEAKRWSEAFDYIQGAFYRSQGYTLEQAIEYDDNRNQYLAGSWKDRPNHAGPWEEKR